MSDVRAVTGKLVRVQVSRLHIRYIPVLTPLSLWNHDMSLVSSPHVELLRHIDKHGLSWDKLKKTRYAEERRWRRQLGMDRWTDGYIYQHIRKRWKTFKSIRDKGFQPKLYGDRPIKLLQEPFWTTRFGLEEPWLKGYEIWDGAGRSMSACFLGKETVQIVWYQDKRPGTGHKGKFESKLKGIEGIWTSH